MLQTGVPLLELYGVVGKSRDMAIVSLEKADGEYILVHFKVALAISLVEL